MKPVEGQNGEMLNLMDVVVNSEKSCFSALIMFSSEKCQSCALAYLRSQKPAEDDFVIHQIFFDVENNRVSNGVQENLQFCVLLGKLKLNKSPLKTYYGDQTNLVKVVQAVATPAAKIAFFA